MSALILQAEIQPPDTGLWRLAKGQNLDCKRVHTCFYFIIERFHHSAVLRNARKIGKMTGRDSDAEMGIASFPPATMPTMQLAFVGNLEH